MCVMIFVQRSQNHVIITKGQLYTIRLEIIQTQVNKAKFYGDISTSSCQITHSCIYTVQIACPGFAIGSSCMSIIIIVTQVVLEP